MINSKLLDNKNEKNNLICSENLYKGACVKIKNSNKTFQVIGLNIGKKICWVREWPFAYDSKKTFALEISQIKLKDLFRNQILIERYTLIFLIIMRRLKNLN